MKIIVQISRLLVGGLFIFSGLIKINDPVGTAIKLEEYFEVFATDFAPFFAYLVPAALFFSVLLSVLEVVLGVAVLLNYRMQLTAWVLLALIVFFTFLTFYSAYFNKVTDCGCFGDAIKLTPWQSFIKDIILLVLIVFLFVYRKQMAVSFSSRTADLAILIVAVLNIGVAWYAIQHLPFIDFRAYKVGANIPQLMQPSAQLRYKYIMTKDGKEEEFMDYPTEGGYEFKEMVLLNPEAQPKITDYSVWNSEGDFTEQTFEGNKLLIIMYDAQKADTDFLPEIRNLAESLPSSIAPIILTASGEEVFESFRHEHQLAMPYYFADATVLKTIIRANPGLVLLKEGVVQAKWHHNDIPESSTLIELSEKQNLASQN
ncbi:DoxX family protein [Porifericola rhodea]|uniref:BT_3928 family protein n=1 Tax=Porifericola rhodea TaxID=930972 RepID=UPI002665978F|nr:BT_3928 family protein [Porifericola rhodea]WKN32371.1 DoxX family protein [Porifericola rhodea]